MFDRNVTSGKTLLKMIDYLHQNPARRGLVECARDSKWPSAAHFEGGESPIPLDPIPFEKSPSPPSRPSIPCRMTLPEKIELIYGKIRQRFESESSNPELVRPYATRPDVGFAALYTPPRYKPNLAIVGQNPGNFGPNDNFWDDEPNRTMMSGRVPVINSYVADQHNFARALQRYFVGTDRQLLNECVGLNISFFQCRGTQKVPRALASFCEDMAKQMIRIMKPRVILCLSEEAFRRLSQTQRQAFGRKDAQNYLSSFDGTPLIRAHHPTGSRSRKQAQISIPAAIIRIRHILENPLGASPQLESPPVPLERTPLISARGTGRHLRRFRITTRGSTIFNERGRNTQLKIILEVLMILGGKDRCYVAEPEIINRIAEHPLIQQSKQSPQALLDWYRTHKLITEGLAEVISN